MSSTGSALAAAFTMLVGLLLAGDAAAQPPVTDDAHTHTGAGEANFGHGPNLAVSPAGHVYLRFDLATLADGTPGSAVDRAILTLYVGNVVGPGALEVYEVAQPWSETTITAATSPLLGSLAAITPPIARAQRNTFMSVDVTGLVRQWLGDDGHGLNGVPNYGLALIAQPGTDVTFDSKENSQTSHEPRLQIQLRGGAGGSGIQSVTADAPISVTGAAQAPHLSLGIVGATLGGTGLTSAGASGNVLRSDGVTWTTAPLTAADIPDIGTTFIRNATSQQSTANFNIGGTGTADVLNATTQFNLGGSRILSRAGTNNLFAGTDAGTGNTTGSANAFFGKNAGQGNTSGSSNAFAGYNAGAGNTTGGHNSFFGDAAGFRNAAANDNSFFGFLAGFHNTASSNSFFGSLAGADNTAGAGNSFFGVRAGSAGTTGSENSYFGSFAGVNNTAGSQNAFFGSDAGFNNTASNNAFFGYKGGYSNTTGSQNVFFGDRAGIFNTSGASNSFLGYRTGFGNATGSNLTAVGANANVGADNLSFATAIGAGAVVGASNTVVLGRAADTVQVPGAFKVAGAFGANVIDAASQFNLGGTRLLEGNAAGNLFVGHSAGLATTTGIINTFVGQSAGQSNTTGSFNTFVGNLTGASTTDACCNNFFGNSAGQFTTTGWLNSFFGGSAGLNNTTGSANAFFGDRAGEYNSSGESNSFFGVFAGRGNTTGTANTLVGNHADVGAPNLRFATAIGAGARVATNNTIVLGRAVDTVQIPGALNLSGGTFAASIVNAATQYDLRGNRVLTVSGSLLYPDSNIFVGVGAGASNTTAEWNAFFGASAGASTTTGGNNSFFGANSGRQNTGGSSNSFFGADSGGTNTTGWFNAFFGASAGRNITTGNTNTLLGAGAGQGVTTGTKNTFVGDFAGGFGTETGTENTFVGTNTGSNNASGSGNVLLGAYANVGAPDLTNATAVGPFAQVSQSNALVLGSINGVNFASADTNVGIGTTAPKARLDVSGGSILVGSPGQGIVLKSPDGAQCRLLSIDNGGALVLTAVACP